MGPFVPVREEVKVVRRLWHAPLLVWAARDLARRPGQTVLLVATLFSIATLVGLLLVLHQTVTAAAGAIVADEPALVVKRVDAHGWRPIPVDEALARASGVAGVLRARVRIRGVVQGPLGPVTVIGVTPAVRSQLPPGIPAPRPGQAVVGPFVWPAGKRLILNPPGHPSMTFTVDSRLPTDSGRGARSMVLLHVADARALLGLADAQASDLALEVFHENEAPAMIPDLARAMAWPVQITTRQERLGRILADLSRRAGMLLAAFVPALLAMALLVAALGAWGRRHHWEMGLFKALGWRAGDILRLYLCRGLLVAAPALVGGAACAALLLFLPGMAWVSRLLFDWAGPPPDQFLTLSSGCAGLFFSVPLVGVPFLGAVFRTGWQAAAADPAEGLTEGGG